MNSTLYQHQRLNCLDVLTNNILATYRYRQDLFEVSPYDDVEETISVRAWSYRPDSGSRIDNVVEAAATHLKQLASVQYNAGDVVVLSANQLHRVVSREQETHNHH